MTSPNEVMYVSTSRRTSNPSSVAQGYLQGCREARGQLPLSTVAPCDYAPRSGSVLAHIFCSKLKGPVPPAWRVSPFCRDRALHPTAGFSGEEAAVLGVLHRERAWPPEPSGKEPTARVGEEVAAGLEPCTQGKVSTQTQRLAVR